MSPPPDSHLRPPGALPALQPTAARRRGGEAEPAAGGVQPEERAAAGAGGAGSDGEFGGGLGSVQTAAVCLTLCFCVQVPTERFQTACEELRLSLNREQEAQELIQEQSRQLQLLQQRVDKLASEQHTLTHSKQVENRTGGEPDRWRTEQVKNQTGGEPDRWRTRQVAPNILGSFRDQQ